MDYCAIFAMASGAGRAATATPRLSGPATRLQYPELLARGEVLLQRLTGAVDVGVYFARSLCGLLHRQMTRSPAKNVSRETFLELF
jgi:hypothetical protein